MAKVKAFQVAGVDMWFYSGDHEPPHFHARRPGHWSAKVFILEAEEQMIQFVRPPDARLRRNERRAIVQGVQQHRLELLEEWEAAQEG